MRVIFYIIQKEFRQIFRDKVMLPIIIVVPMIQLLVLSYTATFEIKNTRLVVVDHDKSPTSLALINKFEGSTFFTVEAFEPSYGLGMEQIKHGKADQLLVIEAGLEKQLTNGSDASVLLVTNAINGSAASLMNAYAGNIIQDYNQEMASKTIRSGMPIQVLTRHWYNPKLDYQTYMVPGILVLLVTLIGMFLSGMNIVKEKEKGTIEQINVTPIRKYQFMAGKLLPFWLLALFELMFGLVLARLFFNIPFEGSIGLLLGVASVYLLVVLGMGLLVSTLSDTMQQAMFISWFFLVVFILMSGLFTPVESMPLWAQYLNKLNPIAYFIQINRMIMLKGSGFSDFAASFYALCLYALLMLGFAIKRYRKVA